MVDVLAAGVMTSVGVSTAAVISVVYVCMAGGQICSVCVHGRGQVCSVCVHGRGSDL